MRRQALALAALLALAGCTGGVADIGGPPDWEFEEVAASAGLDYEASASGVGNGDSGVYVADVDGDGWEDLLAIGGERPVLFENTGGAFERSGALPELSMAVQGALFFDADGDGDEDLLLLPRDGEAVFLQNDGGEFERHANGLGAGMGVAVGASAADYDGDGDLDVFVIQYGDWGETTPEGFLQPKGGYVADDNGAPNLLFENTDDGFERVEDAGIAGEHWTLATSFVDLTGDGAPDIHAANDFNNDTLYVNRGNGTFQRRVMGAATARNGMSSEVGDVDGDGRPDVFVTNIYFPVERGDLSREKERRLQRYFSFVLRSKRIQGNNLMLNRGGGEFAFKSEAYGVAEGGWGWASVNADLDNDGDRDLFHATQTVIELEASGIQFTYPMLFERTGEGFERRDTAELGFLETNGRGVAELDYDNDGDRDLAVASYDGAVRLYENNADALGNSLQLRVLEADGEATAVGATVEVTAGGDTQSAVLNAKADYQSQDTRVLHFGLGDVETVESVTVTWPDGTERTVEDVEANQRIAVLPNGTVRTRADL